jgi:Flp pilus assembly pilin Flp
MMHALQVRVRRLLVALQPESGAVATEYGLLLMLIAIAIVFALVVFGDELAALFQRGVDGLP